MIVALFNVCKIIVFLHDFGYIVALKLLQNKTSITKNDACLFIYQCFL